MSASPKDEIGGLVARVTALERADERHEKWQERTDSRLQVVEGLVPSLDDQKDIEHRIRALESLRWKLAGVVAAVTFLASILGTVIVKKLGG